MPFAARFPCCATIDFNSTFEYFLRGYDDKFYIKIFGICPAIDRWKNCFYRNFAESSINHWPVLRPAHINFSLFRTDKAFCFFHYLTPSLKADVDLKQALCTSAIAWNYCFPDHQVSVLYTGLQSQMHTDYICAFRVKDACTCIFCFHQTLWNLVLSVCWVLLCIRSWSKKIMLFICENTDIEQFASRYQQF